MEKNRGRGCFANVGTGKECALRKRGKGKWFGQLNLRWTARRLLKWLRQLGLEKAQQARGSTAKATRAQACLVPREHDGGMWASLDLMPCWLGLRVRLCTHWCLLTVNAMDCGCVGENLHSQAMLSRIPCDTGLTRTWVAASSCCMYRCWYGCCCATRTTGEGYSQHAEDEGKGKLSQTLMVWKRTRLV